MTALSIREFNANVSKVLARVEAGETVRLTKHGRPVVRLEPDRPRPQPGTPEWQAAYDRMMALMEKGFSVGLGGQKITYEDRTE